MKETLFKASSSTQLAMRNAYSSTALSEFTSHYNIDLELTSEQSSAVGEGKKISFSDEQMEDIVNQLISKHDIDAFLNENSDKLLPLSVSLFVINDKLWSMMERKVWDKKKMLAMSTIPLCTWDQNHETTSNPKGIKRWPIKTNIMELSFDKNPKMKIQGQGGDFSGFIEQSHLTMRKWGIPDTRRLIPNYTFESLRIELRLIRAKTEIHPHPRDELDYDFSDHAKVFFEHGLLIQLPGEDVTLQVAKRKPNQMAGDVFLLLGKRFDTEEVSNHELLVDIWIRLFRRRLSMVT